MGGKLKNGKAAAGEFSTKQHRRNFASRGNEGGASKKVAIILHVLEIFLRHFLDSTKPERPRDYSLF